MTLAIGSACSSASELPGGDPACTTCSSSGAPAPDGGAVPGSTPGPGGADAADASSAAGAGSGGTGGVIGPSVPLPGCTGCRVHVPAGYAGGGAPLLVSLHGDEGPATGIASVISLWSGAADAHGYFVLALPCGADLGCSGNWSGWLAAGGYQITQQHMDWMNAQATKVESLYNIDKKREYLSGYSGGAYVLGYLAQAQAARYAAAAFVAGGLPAWTGTGHPCPVPKIPGYFLGGDGDYRTAGQMSDTARSFEMCGQERALDIVAGADHAGTIASLGSGRANVILGWFDARPLK